MIEPKNCEVAGCKNLAWRRGLCTTHRARVRKYQDVRADVPVGTYNSTAYMANRAAYLDSIRDRVMAVVKEAREPMTASDYAWVLGLPEAWTGVEPLVVSTTTVGWILSRDPNMAITYTANKDNLYAMASVVR